MQNRHFLKLLGLSRYTAVFVAFLVSAMTLAATLSFDVHAKGEDYSWEDKETISGTGGKLAEGVNLFSKKQVVNVYPTPTIIEAYTYDDVVTTPDGCVVNLAIQVNSANKSQGTLRRVADVAGGSNQCPDSYKISDDFNIQLRLGNSDAAGSNPSTVVTVTIRSLVVEGEDFPADSDTLTLKNQGSNKVLATKKASTQHAYASDGYEGYERTFKFKTTPGQKFYEACSAALGQCATADLSILTGPLNIYVIEIKQVVTNVTCSAGPLGWVLCPLSEALVSAIEGIAEILKGLLIYQPLLTSEQGKATKAIWQSLLVIANVGLVIAILVIVFSQATSVGLSSYGIKKLLPRVIAAAILMNLSFYICAAAVDLSNILGISIKTIVEAGLSQISGISAIDPDLQAGADSTDWIVTITGALLIAAVAAATGAIFLLIPVLLAGFMAILTALLIVAARQVLITLLIIVAPLAILAWILPNTDEWFTKWRKLFTILLLMFPMIMAIFYGSILVSSVILTSSTNTGNGLNNFTVTLLAFLVLVVPLFSLPFVMKSVGGVLERFGAITNNRGKGIVDRSRKKSEEWKGNSTYQRGKAVRKQIGDDHKSTRFAKRVNRGGFAGIAAGGVAGNIGKVPALRNTVAGAQNMRMAEVATAAEADAFDKRVAARMKFHTIKDTGYGELKDEFQTALGRGDQEQVVASLRQLGTMGSSGRAAIDDLLRGSDGQGISINDEEMQKKIFNATGKEMYSSLVGSRGDVAKGGFKDGRWTSGGMESLGYEQLATQDSKTLQKNNLQISAEAAYHILQDSNLKSRVQDKEAMAIFEQRAQLYTPPPAPPSGPSPTPSSGLPPSSPPSAPTPPSTPPTPPPAGPAGGWNQGS